MKPACFLLTVLAAMAVPAAGRVWANTTSTAISACAPSTVYLPVTELVTTTTTVAPPASTAISTTTHYDTSYITVTRSALISTTTVIVPYTSYLTVMTTASSPFVAPTAAPTTDHGPYSYYETSGSTSWLNGSPSSGVSLIQTTAAIYITPVQIGPSGVSADSEMPTYSVPPFTSTTFVLDPETSTSTRTSYITHYLSYAPSASASTATSTQLTFSPGDATTMTTTVHLTVTTGITFTTTMTLSRSSSVAVQPGSSGSTPLSSMDVPATNYLSSTSSETSASIPLLSSSTNKLPSTVAYTFTQASTLTVTASAASEGSAASSLIPVPSPSEVLGGTMAPTTETITGPATLITESLSYAAGVSTASVSTPATSSSQLIVSPLSSIGSGRILTTRFYSNSTISQSSSDVTPVTLSTGAVGLTGSSVPSTLSTITGTAGPTLTSIALTSTSIPIALSSSGSTLVASYYSSNVGGRNTSSLASSSDLSVVPPTSVAVTASPLSSVSSTTTNYSITMTPSASPFQERLTLTFDDLPLFAPTAANGSDIMHRPPIGVNGLYNHLSFNGYVYAPNTIEPFSPVSSPNVAIFLANATGMTIGSPSAMAAINGTKPGEINDPVPTNPAFYFDPYSVYAGCDNTGPDDCTLEMTGYTWDAAANTEVPSFTHSATLNSCPGMTNCHLQLVDFPASFRALSGLQLLAYTDEPVVFYLDNLVLGWTQASTESVKIRAQAP